MDPGGGNVNYQHASSAPGREAGSSPHGGDWPAVAIAAVHRRRTASRRCLLRRRKGRPDTAVHGLGLRDLAPGGTRDRGPLPVGPSLVARRAARRNRRKRTAFARRQLVPCRKPAGTADRQHGRDHRGRTAPASADRTRRGDGPRRAGGIVEESDAAEFWRTWWLGDTSGGLVVLPLLLAWARDPLGAWRRIRTWEGAAVIAAVVALGVAAVSTEEPITYMVFPALIWAAFRFGSPGATLSIAITAAVAIGVTAHDVGPFSQQAIDHRTLSTQLYIAVAALTTLFLSAVVSERERSASDLAEARRNEGERAVEERRRIARDLHDSVSQALFSTVLHTRTAQKSLGQQGAGSGRVAQSLSAIGELTKSVQSEMRALIFELHRDPVHDGLVSALARHASGLRAADLPTIEVRGPEPRLALSEGVENQLYGIAREALANVLKHAHATAALVRVEAQARHVLVEVRDNGHGFDTSAAHPGHFGLESMRSRAAEIGGQLTLASAPGTGTLVRVRVE